jgi:photosynthetic reaction center cytochrome c subunit
MVRELNNEFIVGLTSIQPPNRLGVTGDISKVNCATCHQGVNKPLYGAQMLKAHPELSGPNALKDAMEINAPPVPAAPSKTTGVEPSRVPAADMKQSAVVLPTRVN